VKKGLGWLLREAAKANPDQTVKYLMTIRERTPRLVLRTACETLPAETSERVLQKPNRGFSRMNTDRK
jgi:3-methyladenine DNA glycosylase AlkD